MGEGSSPASTLTTANLYPNIRAIRLQINTRWGRPNSIPGPVLANVLRGAIGLTLRKLVCVEDWMDHDCPPCPLYEQCAYGQVFSPTPPADSEKMRLQADLPRPFVLEPPGMHPDEPVTTEGLNFKLMLFGSAIDWLPYFITTLDRLGRDGIGRDRVPFTIEKISTCHPSGEEILFTSGSRSVSLPKRVLTTEDLLTRQWPIELPISPESNEVRRRVLARMGLQSPAREIRQATSGRPQLQIKFLTPLLLKSGSGIAQDGTRIQAQEIRERPPFGVLIRRLRDRLSSLCTFFGEPWDCPDFAALGHMADEVNIISSNTTWLTRNRHSTRTGQTHEISGLIGTTTYEFPNQQTHEILTLLLKIGELIHIGKSALWGNGAISCNAPTKQ